MSHMLNGIRNKNLLKDYLCSHEIMVKVLYSSWITIEGQTKQRAMPGNNWVNMEYRSLLNPPY